MIGILEFHVTNDKFSDALSDALRVWDLTGKSVQMGTIMLFIRVCMLSSLPSGAERHQEKNIYRHFGRV